MTTTEKSEAIRAWYDRTTRTARRIITWASVIGAISAIAFYFLVPHAYTLRLQVFNGAWVIPIAALIWIVAFVWIFLIPSREVGFRSQEALEDTTATVKRTVKEHFEPALAVWLRLGQRLEKELDKGLISEIQETFRTVSKTAIHLQATSAASSVDIKKLKDDLQPALLALRRIQNRCEAEIEAGFFDNIRAATDSVRMLGGMPDAKPNGRPATPKEPDLDRALRLVAKKPLPAVHAPAASMVVPVPLVSAAPAPLPVVVARAAAIVVSAPAGQAILPPGLPSISEKVQA